MFSALHSGPADPFAEVEGLSSPIIQRLEGQAEAGATEKPSVTRFSQKQMYGGRQNMVKGVG